MKWPIMRTPDLLVTLPPVVTPKPPSGLEIELERRLVDGTCA